MNSDLSSGWKQIAGTPGALEQLLFEAATASPVTTSRLEVGDVVWTGDVFSGFTELFTKLVARQRAGDVV